MPLKRYRIVRIEYAPGDTRYIVQRRWLCLWLRSKTWCVRFGTLYWRKSFDPLMRMIDAWDGYTIPSPGGTDLHADALAACRLYITDAQRKQRHRRIVEVLDAPEPQQGGELSQEPR